MLSGASIIICLYAMYNVFQGNSNITGYRICCLLPLILSVDLDAEKNMEKILKVISLEGATSPTSLAESTGMTTDEVGEIFCHVVAKYTVCLYGKRQITKWLSNNKGCTYLDMITMSDFAYIASLLKNNFEYWPEQYNIKKMSKDEQKQYKEENQLKKPKFTDRAGQSRALYSCGWSEEGLNFYYETLDKWKHVARRKESWEELEMFWQMYTEETGFDNQWKKRSRATKKTVPPTEEEPVRARFSLPGTEGFDDVFSWKKNPRRVSDENDRVHSAASSRHSDDQPELSASGEDEEDNHSLMEEESSEDEGGLNEGRKRTKLDVFGDDDSDDY